MMNKNDTIYIAGHRGMVGAAIVRLLTQQGYTNLITKTHAELDLTRQQEVERFFAQEQPKFVFLAAAKVGGILANSTYKADFIYDNITIANNIVHSAWKYNVTKLINLGSSCIYPKFAEQPIKEESLLTDTLEKTNESYAIAKIAAIKLCRYFNEQYDTHFLSAMPSNLYGIGDNFHLKNSHVLPAMIRKFHEAKEQHKESVELWGDGSPEREFLFVDDLANALIFLMQDVTKDMIPEHINVGYGSDISIKNLAETIKNTVGYQGNIVWNTSMPNGTPKKLMDSSKIHALGWKAETSLEEGICATYNWFKEHYLNIRK